MHLGLARAQLLPRSDGYRRFTGSPIDALVYLVGLSCQIPIRGSRDFPSKNDKVLWKPRHLWPLEGYYFFHIPILALIG